jgi:hypothetical protein
MQDEKHAGGADEISSLRIPSGWSSGSLKQRLMGAAKT